MRLILSILIILIMFIGIIIMMKKEGKFNWGDKMNFNKRENYLKIIRVIFQMYPQKHQKLIQDLHDWLDGRYKRPKTKELRAIIADITKGE